MSDNQVTLVGNLTRDAELRFTAGGKAVASFGLAVNRRWMVANEWKEQVSFFNCTAWDTLAENFAASCGKGARVIVTGRLEQREYETKEGEKRNVVELVVDEAGPSMRWATASVERIVRGVQSASGDTASVTNITSAGSVRANANVDPIYGDTEPF